MKGPINVLLKKGDYYYVTQKWKYWQLCYVPAVWTAYQCSLQGSFDSKFGSGTENAVKKYQGKKGLTQDGIVGDGTWNALVSDIKNHPAAPEEQRLLRQYSGWPCRFRHL